MKQNVRCILSCHATMDKLVWARPKVTHFDIYLQIVRRKGCITAILVNCTDQHPPVFCMYVYHKIMFPKFGSIFGVSTIIQELESVTGNHCSQQPHGRVSLSKSGITYNWRMLTNFQWSYFGFLTIEPPSILTFNPYLFKGPHLKGLYLTWIFMLLGQNCAKIITM